MAHPPASQPLRATVTSSVTAKDYVHFSDKLTNTLEQVNKTIQENKEMIDTIQELGIELSRAIASLSVMAVKYVKIVDSALDAVAPIVTSLPITPKKTVDFLNDVRKIADTIVDSCEKSQRIAGDVENGLTSGNIDKLKSQSGELKTIAATVRNILPDKN